MKKIITKIILICLLTLSHKPIHSMQWVKDSCSAGGKNICSTSTETKILLGIGALVAGGIAYSIYRYYNPTNEQIMTEAAFYMRQGECFITLLPRIHPLDENTLNEIGWQLVNYQWQNPTHLGKEIARTINALQSQCDTINKRIAKYQKTPSSALTALKNIHHDACNLISLLKERLSIINMHAHYLRMFILQYNMQGYIPALPYKNSMPALVPIIRHACIQKRFPFLTYIQQLDTDIQNISNELAITQNYDNYMDIYARRHAELNLIAQNLIDLRTTILGSAEYKEDQIRKDVFDMEQRRLELEAQRVAQEQERIRIEAQKAAHERAARLEKLRIEQERLKLERERLDFQKEQAQSNQ